MIWTVAKKELRGYFNSAIAVIFLAAFLVATMYLFFWHEKFFARGIADLRPLFAWMPQLLIIIVSALAMRLWSEERRAGTLEVLLTLPVERWKLVLGKFLAGMVLIAVGLALTLGLPITISMMGHLDWGPVIGGYLATLLLAAAYLAIGMCISAATSNGIVAVVGTAFACGAVYLIGYFGEALGAGARFDSVARGVLDLRDLAYYGAILVVAVAVNVLLLQSQTWASGPRARPRRRAAVLGVVLVIANVIAFNLWLAPVRRARIDLTQDGTYSLSDSTDRIVRGLDEQLLIRGYFSEKTHPKLAPLIPQIEDLLHEYEISGGGKVRVEIIDPTNSDPAKLEAKERFGIDPTPLQFATDTEQSVVNSYFAVAVQYGDQHIVLGIDDLIQVRAAGEGVDVTVKNLEYQLTKTIKKAVAEFSSVDALFASAPGKITLTAYVSSKGLPENWADAPAKLKQVVEKLQKQSNGKLAFTQTEPTTEAEARSLFEKYGLRPFQDLFSGAVYYFHFLLQVGDRTVRIMPPQEMGEAALEKALTDGLKRAAPGFTRVVGMWVPPAGDSMPMMQGMPPQQMPPPQQFETLKRALAGNYEVRDVKLSAAVPEEVECLVLAGPVGFDAAAAANVDQFLMRGGALVVLAGHYRLAPLGGLAVEKVATGLEPILKAWGVTVADEMVLDTKSDSFPIPQNRDLGNGMTVREIAKLPYPFFVQMEGDQLAEGSPITSGIAGSVMHWGSEVTAEPKVGEDTRRVDLLLRTSEAAWTSTSTKIEPDLQTYPGSGFPPPDVAVKRGPRVMAVAVTGGFATGTPAPVKPAAGSAAPAPGSDARRIEHSPPDARLVVFGSSAFASDDILNLARQLGSALAESNVELVQNAVDWAMADTDLLAIRSRNTASRALTVDVDSRGMWRTVNIVLALLGLALVVLAAYLRRRAVTPVLVGKEG